ncbi:Detected protein of unknown function [Hibiscus syriacus]|uniref:Regulator of Vps4 activity in the MVB pathway protein n=1 Tax=Hibiscus syriacus TaxID=106335 RepID=A0A6A2ZC30_HIBSY|nr:Detected protein of unknown function [Hibiscus syriacus]
MRLETIEKKRNAVEKYLKNDVADLLMNGLDYNAYSGAERLLMEQKRTACYDLIEQFCDSISKHISVMQMHSECPEECREAVPSLINAAARFADLPELRDLRTIFTEKYGNSLEAYLNQEFVLKLKVEPPTKEMKLKLMHDIAQEFSIEWDSKALEQKLFKPPPLVRNKAQNKSPGVADDDRYNLHRNKNDTFERSNDTTMKMDLVISEGEVTDKDIPKTSSSDGSVSEDGIENRKPSYYRFVPPPYVRPSQGKGDGITEEPMAPSDNINKVKNNKWDDSLGEKEDYKRDEEEKKMDELLMHYSKKKSPYEWLSKWKTALRAPPPGRQESDNTSKGLALPPGTQESNNTTKGLAPSPGTQESENSNKGPGVRSTKIDPSALPARIASFSKEAMSSTEKVGRHTRASSFQPHMLAGHVHPKLPDYDDLEAHLASLRRQ